MGGVKRDPSPRPLDGGTSLAVWCALAAVLLVAAGVRWRMLDVPLERDEGEYAYIGQLMLQGVPPYTLAFNMKLPGIYAAYAVVLGVLGQTPRAIHLGLLFVNAATALLAFLLARRWTGPPGALVAAAAFALLSTGQPVQGIFANAEHFVLPFALGGLLLAQDAAPRAWRSLAAGALLGAGVLMKQHGAAFAACGLLFALLAGGRDEPWRPRWVRAGRLAAGIVAPYALTCLVLAAAGAFGRFWFWTVQYASAYTAQVPPAQAWTQFLSSAAPIVAAAPLLWLLAGVGPLALWLDPTLRPQAWRVKTFCGFSLLALCPGFFFRPHYFVLALPAAGVLVGATFEAARRLFEGRRRRVVGTVVAAALVVAACGDALSRQRAFLFRMSPREASRSTYGANPFPESLEIARYIREHSSEKDTIAVLGSEPQIAFYARRRSVTPYIYAYPLMELHDYAKHMQDEMIADIESGRPRFIVFVRVQTSWLQRPGSHLELFEWFERYYRRHYRVVGLAEIVSNDTTTYLWDDEVHWPPRTGQWIALMERTDDPS